MLAGLAGIIILLMRKLPEVRRIDSFELKNPQPSGWQQIKNRVSEKLRGEHSSRFFAGSLQVIERGLLRLRVGFLRIENAINALVKKVRAKSYPMRFRSKYGKRLSHIEEKEKEEGKEVHPQELEREAPAAKEIQPLKWIEWKQAEKQYLEIIVRNPRDGAAYKRLAEIYIGQDNFIDARASLEEVLRLDPMDEEARTILRQLNGHASRAQMSKEEIKEKSGKG